MYEVDLISIVAFTLVFLVIAIKLHVRTMPLRI